MSERRHGRDVSRTDIRPLHADGDHIYAIRRDDLGVRHVIRLRVTRWGAAHPWRTTSVAAAHRA